MIHCPACQKPFDVEPEQLRGEGVRLFCDRCHKLFGLESLAPTPGGILVALENDAHFEIIAQILGELGHTPVRARNGAETVRMATATAFKLVLVDVALSDMYAFDIVTKLKALPADFLPHVVLLPSVYDKTKYKRTPKSLYGADDYLEQHHLPDKLPVVVARLFQKDTPSVDGELMLQRRSDLRATAGEDLSEAPSDQYRQALSDRARLIARRIVLDISLYHEEQFLSGLKNHNLRVVLKNEIEEAKRFLSERLPSELKRAAPVDFIEEALDELVRAKEGAP